MKQCQYVYCLAKFLLLADIAFAPFDKSNVKYLT